MADIDFQKILDGMITGTGQGDPIKSIYEIIPTLDSTQQHLLFQAYYFIEKYDLGDMRAMFSNFLHVMDKNKNLSFLGTQNLRSLLSAYTQNELVRGIKVNANNDVSSSSQITQG